MKLSSYAKSKGISVERHLIKSTHKHFSDIDNLSFLSKNLRIKRGLFKSNNGTKINADLNGSLQILTKVVGKFAENFSENSILRLVVSPVRITLQSQRYI